LIPLSFAQRRLWFLNQTEGPSSAYNIPIAFRIRGELNVQALDDALADVVGRHEPLRTRFPQNEGVVRQEIVSPEACRFRLSTMEVEGSRIAEHLAMASRRKLDIENEIPFAASLFEMGDSESVLLLVIHHIAADGWSIGPLLRDLQKAYAARVHGRQPKWAELPVQYADYAVWQQELLGSEEDGSSLSSRQLEYWKQALADLPAQLPLPVDRQRSANGMMKSGRLRCPLSATIREKLSRIALTENASLFMVLLAAVASLLYRLGAGEDIPLGTAVAGRTDNALDDLVGCFVNTLVLRARTGNRGFRELLAVVRETALAAYANQDVPFERIVEVLNPPRMPARHPLFQVMVTLQNTANTAFGLDGVAIQSEPVELDVAKFDLMFAFRERAAEESGSQGIDLELAYSADLFDRESAEGMARRLERLLDGIAESPSRRIGEIDLLGESERAELEEWNQTGIELPEGTMAGLWEEQVARDPRAVALVGDFGALTYGELNERANRVAHLLVGKGIGPEDLVGVAMPRSADMIVSLIAILKSGAGYLPLDPEYPAARVALMMDEARAVCVLTAGDELANLPSEAERIDVHEVAERRDLPAGNPAPRGSTGNVCYVMYTSGSTGTPKGIVIPQRAVIRLVRGGGCARLDRDSVVAQFAPLSFDASTFEIWGALLNGGRVAVLAPGLPTLDELGAELRRYEVGTLWLTAGLFHQMVEHQMEDLGGIRELLAGGDVLDGGSIRKVLENASGCTVINGYGPTEATTFTTCHRMERAEQVSERVPIGRPIGNTRVYVLDEQLQPAPIGVWGELYIGGCGLARGYVGRSGLTAERFVAHPREGGKRMYRTGDVVRWRRDGRLEFGGRADQQVKLRGFRIEPGEVEAALQRQRGVGQAVVMAREDQPGEKRLVAYVTGEGVDAEGLRAALQGELPDYMTPAAIVVLERFPLNANGKVDRKALAPPEYTRREWRGPRTPREEILCSLFAQTLGLELVGIDDNFFELGGHSLLATVLVSRIRATLGVELPISAPFESPTPAELARALAETERRARPPIRKAPRRNSIPLSYAQQRLWFLNRLKGTNAAYNMPLTLRIRGQLDVKALRTAIGDVVGRHETLRTVYSDRMGAPSQEIHAAGSAAFSFAIREIPESALAQELVSEQEQSFDLRSDLPLRASVFAMGPDEHVLQLVIHHIAADGWSFRPLLSDLWSAYEARCKGQAPAWSPLPLHYADYAIWQRETLGEAKDPGSRMGRQLTFWKETLKDLPEQLDLPLDRSRPTMSDQRGDTVTVAIPVETHRRILDVARPAGATPFMVLQAAVAVLLSRFGAGTDIPIGSPIAGRTDEALEDLVGLFVNTLVLRTDTSGDPTFNELVARVRAANLKAYANQDVPFERLVEELNPARSLGRHPLFQVMLAFDTTAQGWHGPPGLNIRPEPMSLRVSTFDLTFTLRDLRDHTGAPRGVEGKLRYDTDLFERPTAEALVRCLERIVDEGTKAPDQPIGAISLIDSEKRATLLSGFGHGGPVIAGVLTHRLIEARARATPHAIAVRCGELSLTYDELNRRANRLSHRLAFAGAGPESVVGLCLSRSVDLVVALLGILKSGAAYVPLDPSYPTERLAYIVDRANPLTTVTHSELLPSLPPSVRNTIVIDSEREQLAAEPDSNPGRTVRAEHAAYVLFTSGSTGAPKGVVVRHEGLANYLQWASGTLFQDIDCLPQLSSVNFDASLKQLLAPLVAGKTVFLLDRDGDAIQCVLRLLDSESNAAINCVPSLWSTILDAIEVMEREERPTLRRLLLGGERIPRGLIERTLRVYPNVRIGNLYGPTEATANATFADGLAPDYSPIGAPIAGTIVYVLDDRLVPVPVGVKGELYLAGAGLARGYLDQTALTAERFVADPHGHPGSRMYRTGDVVKWRRNGALEYIGRADQQVKIRGFRVEPGEVESALLSIGVGQCVVTAREDHKGETRLIAYVTPGASGETSPEDLRWKLASKLPEYEVPSLIVFLPEFPLDANGKIDPQALLEPEAETRPWNGPRAPEEEILCSLYCDLLGQRAVSIDESFFALGGHSLLAMALTGRIRAIFGVNFPLRHVFESPTVAGLAGKLKDAEAAGPPLRPMTRSGPIPLSFAQSRLWFLNRMGGAAGVDDTIPLAWRLRGKLDAGALELALQDLIRRHETLRTRFSDSDGDVEQVILAELEEFGLICQPSTESGLAGDLSAAAKRSFDLAKDAPVRAHLFELGAADHVLLLVLHHVAADGWSMRPLERDLSRAYAARCHGREPDWQPLPVQYADYALWQREVLGSGGDPDKAMSGHMAYWTQALADLPEELSLPTDHPRPAQMSFLGRSAQLRIGEELHGKLLRLAQNHNATLFMVVQAAVATLLMRAGAGNDLPLGTAIAGRTDALLDPLIGFFVNTLVLRTDTSGNPTFEELIARVRRTDLAAYSHQDFPFERLVEELRPERSLSKHPLFQVMVTLQHLSPSDFRLADVAAVRQPIGLGVTKFDLTFGLQERRAADGSALGIEGGIRYVTDLYDHETVEAMARRLERLLEAVADSPGQRIGDVDLLGEGERTQLLEEWNVTGRELPGGTMATLFEEQVARNPNAVAVDGSLTYGELNTRANRLAHLLIGKGIGPEEMVAVAMNRSAEMLVSLLAIVKSGAAYLPLDPEYPPARLALMVADARPICVLATGEADLSNLPSEVERIDIRQLPDDLPSTNPSPRGNGESACYVMYTSGSTGTPKGIVIPQRGVIRLVRNTDYVDIRPADRIAQIANSAFDATTFEIWGALLNGASVSIIDRETTLSSSRFEERLRRDGITVLFLTTALFNQMARERSSIFAGLRSVLFGGEGVDPRWPREVLAAGAPERLLHVYGPTETTTYATWELVRSVESESETIPIGQPIANSRAYVLDACLQPVPLGVRGELYLTGKGVARGYLRQGGQTAERFVANPFEEPGQRMYRTGDVVRRNRDGRIEFIGRADEQVKIRGFRVELGEIEAALRELIGVAQAVVVVREDEPAERRLVGYVAGNSLDGEQLREALGARLPEYMMPSAVVVLETLPLNNNGKVDRQALPAPEYAQKGWRAPRTPQEEILCALFAETLGVERVGLDDNFFELGGHSLLAMRLVSRLRRMGLGLEINVQDLFEAPTVGELAQRLVAEEDARPPVEPMPRSDEIPLSFAQRRLWFLNRLEGPSATYNIPLALRLSGRVSAVVLEAALCDVIERHESLRTIFPEKLGKPRQQILSLSESAFRLDRLSASEGEVVRLVTERAVHGFDLSTEIPFRACLWEIGAEDHVLLIVIHHIAGDGWSLGPLSRDLARAYIAHRMERKPDWSALPVQYADYTLWQQQVLGSESDSASPIARQLNYWKEKLQGLPEQLDLPFDRVRPAVSTYQGGSVVLRVDAAMHERLLGLARAHHASLFMVLQAAVAALLTRLGAGSDISIGSPIAGRTDSKLEDLIGFFVNTLVLRTDTSANPTFEELLTRVRQTDLQAYAHQDLPFERLVEELKPERSLARHPLFQVMLTFQSERAPAISLDGLNVEAFSASGEPAKFDLAVGFRERRTADGRAAGMDGGLRYSTDLFEPQTAQALAGRLLRVLESVAADPRQRVADLPILTDEERELALYGWNQSQHDIPATTLPEFFELQAEKTPHALAFSGHGRSMTYLELNERANRLAHYLISRGIGPEDVVGISLPRSEETIVSILGVLKAGAAFLPIDLDYPAERRAFMIDDARPAFVFAGEPETGLEIETFPAENPVRGTLRPSHPAYVIYTSGSTGVPKGVIITHSNVAAFLKWTSTVFTSDDLAGVIAATSICFDLSIFEIFATLATGGCVLLVPNAMHADSAAAQATLINTVPSAAAELLRSGRMPRVRVANIAGEPLPRTLVDGLYAYGVERVYNLYGPTEDTTYSTFTLVDRNPAAMVTIGKPVGSSQAYVLDENLQPVPEGVAGELYLGGAGLARGYLGRGALTAERFVAHPWGPPGSRMYRTGDLVRRRHDGDLEYLGRVDQQVKLRGYRIEPGEIEAALVRDPEVAQAAVVVRDGRLVAYVAGAGDSERLRQDLRARLPVYMLPAAIVWLESLPLNRSGKVDRKALPAPAFEVKPWRGPRTSHEEILCSLVAQTLGVERVGLDDNFFELGGDSIVSIQLVSRARKAGLRITPRDVFQYQTVEALAGVARRVDDEMVDEADQAVGPLEPAPIMRWAAERRILSDGFSQSVCLQVPPSLGLERLRQAVQRIVDHQDVLRMQVVGDWNGADWSLEIPPVGTVNCADWVRRVEMGSDRRNALEREAEAARRRLSPKSGVMLQVVWLDAGAEQPGWLLVTAHHLAVDGVSWRILLPDLRRAWEGAGGDGKGTSFRRWHERLRGETVPRGRELELWLGMLSGAEEPIEGELDPDRDRMGTAGVLRLTLPAPVTERLLTEVPAVFHGAINDVLLAGLYLTVGRWMQEQGRWHGSIVVDLEGHGREEIFRGIDLSRTVGWFTSLYPVRLEAEGVDLDAAWAGASELGRAVKRIKESLRRVPDGGLGYGLLRYAGGSKLRGNPKIGFNYLGRFRTGVSGGDWEAVSEKGMLVGGVDAEMPLPHALEVSAVAVERANGTELSANWTWAPALIDEADVRRIAYGWFEALQHLAEYARQPDAGGLTPSDLPLVVFSQEEIEDFEEWYAKKAGAS
jgi:amino acid adenylation domain-containing protein/non-ribosomal peptide synthase protein (TIGR01720 family)